MVSVRQKEMLQIVRLDTDIKYLLPHCEALFGSQISTSNSFTVACMFLMQNYLCGMQGLLPEGFLDIIIWMRKITSCLAS